MNCENLDLNAAGSENLKSKEAKYKRETRIYLSLVIALAVALIFTSFYARDSVSYVVVSTLHTSAGFVLVLMIDKASKKLSQVRKQLKQL